MAALPVCTAMNNGNDDMSINRLISPERLLILFDKGQHDILHVIADVLGQTCCIFESLESAAGRTDNTIAGLNNEAVPVPAALRNVGRTVISTHAIDTFDLRDEKVSSFCDYEYLYTQKQFIRRDVARFFGFILGQCKPHDELKLKSRTTYLSTTFPDIRAALPNLDILCVGADAFELRVDLLEEPLQDGSEVIPSVKYVGEQLMLLRQRTELPIIFTTRCKDENGRFPMDDPDLQYKYLQKALQWGCEYIDVELRLPEDIKRKLSEQKGNSKIISALHDFSGEFSWKSRDAEELFSNGMMYGDIVKMNALVNSAEENYELEQFRLAMRTQHPHSQFSGVNMGPIGQLSRTLNKTFTPTTHPLLPIIAAPGQLSAAEINFRLHSMGILPSLDIFAIGNLGASGQAMFLEKCLNELSLPHQVVCLDHTPDAFFEGISKHANFGGITLTPPWPATVSNKMELTDGALSVGQIDTIVPRSDSKGPSLLGDNVTYKAIRATLCLEYVPSAYEGRPCLILANTEAQAASAISALATLDIGHIYTLGFKAKASPVPTRQFRGIDDMKKLEEPFVVISALPAQQSVIVSPLLKHYSKISRKKGCSGRVFIDISTSSRSRGDSVATAKDYGWSAHNLADVNAFALVETLRLLVGCNVGFDFVRLVGGNRIDV